MTDGALILHALTRLSPPAIDQDYSGRLRVGIVKSEAKTRVVLPPLAGLMVPERLRMARGSPLRLLRVATTESDQS